MEKAGQVASIWAGGYPAAGVAGSRRLAGGLWLALSLQSVGTGRTNPPDRPTSPARAPSPTRPKARTGRGRWCVCLPRGTTYQTTPPIQPATEPASPFGLPGRARPGRLAKPSAGSASPPAWGSARHGRPSGASRLAGPGPG